MRDVFDGKVHPCGEEDLVYPDEASEIDGAEALEEQLEKLEKFARRKAVKNLTEGRKRWTRP